MLDPITTALSLTPASIILAKGACKAVTRIGDLFLAGPENRARYQKALWEAKTQKDSERLLAGECVFDGEKCIPYALPDIRNPHIWTQVEQAEEMRNLAKNLTIALEAAQNIQDDKVSDSPVSTTFFARWRNEAKLIGEDVIQQHWGRILAEEVTSPGAFSLKTLDVLKNITVHQAELFTTMAKYIVHGVFVRDAMFDPTYFSYTNELELVDAELFVGTGLAGISEALNRGIVTYIGNGFAILFQCSPTMKSGESIFTGVPLTRAGRELMAIADIPATSKEEISEICGSMLRSSMQFRTIKHIKAVPYVDGKVCESPIYFEQAL